MAKLSEHKDVAQALMAAETLIDKHADIAGYTLEYSPSKRLPFDYWCTFHSLRVLPREWGRYKHTGVGPTLAKAIYKAIKETKDALGEEQQP